MKLAFIDTETTGLDPQTSVVLEFAAIVVHPTEGHVIARYETKIKPTEQELQYAHPKALEKNGYTDEAWEGAPTIEQLAPDIGALLEGCVLVGHNVAFDETMLKAHFAAYGIEERVPYKKIDTQTLAYEHLTPLGLKSVSLDRIREFLGWSKEGAHTAMKDVEDTKQLFNLLWRMTPWQRLVLRIKLRFGWKV